MKDILGVGSIVKWEGQFFKVVRLYDDRVFTQFAQLEQKGKLIADVETKFIKWNGKQFIVKVER